MLLGTLEFAEDFAYNSASMKRTLIPTLLALLWLGGCTKVHLSYDYGRDVAALAEMTRKDCGVTWSLTSGNEAGSGLFVTGAYPESGEVRQGFPYPYEIRGFIQRHAGLLKNRENFVGTWCVTPQGDCHAPGPVTCYLDISRETATLAQAARLASACNQISVARLGKDKLEIIDSFAGHHFGNGKPIAGAALVACRKARGE